MWAGTVITGPAVSWTVTVNVAVARFPWASVAVQATIVLPRENALPDAGKHETGTVPSTSSVAVGAGHVTMTWPPGPASLMTTAGTPEMTGAVVSTPVGVGVGDGVGKGVGVGVGVG